MRSLKLHFLDEDNFLEILYENKNIAQQTNVTLAHSPTVLFSLGTHGDRLPDFELQIIIHFLVLLFSLI